MNIQTEKIMRLRLYRCLTVIGIIVLMFGIQPVALAVDDPTIFELDRNALDPTPPTGDDWETLWNDCGTDGEPDGAATGCGNSFAFTGIIPDTFSPINQDQIFTGGGSKDDIDIPSWKWKKAKPTPDKNNITNAYSAAYEDDGETIIYYGADRFSNNGDAQMGFWFLQQFIETEAGGTFGPGVHQNGDLLVLANFTGGGLASNVEIWEWCAGCGDGGNTNLKLRIAAGDCTGAVTDPACALANTAATSAPWPYTPKSGSAGTFPTASIFEGGLNLSFLFPEGTPCFSGFLAETRSSSSTDAVLKDFATGGFPLCSIDASKVCTDDETEVGEGPGNLTYNIRGCAINDGGGDVTALTLLNSIGGAANELPSDLAWFSPPVDFVVADCTDAVALKDAAENGTPFDPAADTLAVGEIAVYQFTETTAANTPSDTVTIDAEGVDGTSIDAATASAICPAQLFPASLSVDKFCSANLENDVDAERVVVKIGIRGEVCNTGDLPLTNVMLSDDPNMPLPVDVSITPQDFDLAPTGETGDCVSYTGNYYPNSIPFGNLCPFMDQVLAIGTADGEFADPTAAGCTTVGTDVECSATSNSPTCELRVGGIDNDCSIGLEDPSSSSP